MASGIITLDSTRNILEGRIVWDSTSNGSEKNTSNVTASLQVKRNDGYSTKGTWTGNLQIDNRNESFSLSSTTVGNDWVTMKEFTVEDKSHNSDGSGNCYIYGKVNGPSGTSMSGNYVEGSENVTLDKIPRYANITNFRVSNYTINTAEVQFDLDSAVDEWQYWIENVSSEWSNFSTPNTIHDLNPGTNYNVKMRVKRIDSQLWSESDYYNFTTYNIAQVITAPSFNIGESPTITWNSTSGCKVYVYSENIVDGKVESQLTNDVEVTNQTSYTYSLDANTLYKKIPNSNSGIIRYVLRSENDGKVYYNYLDANYNAINSNPDFDNWTYEDINDKTLALTGDNQKIINEYSTVKATVTVANKAIAKNFASMIKYRLIIGNLSDEVDYSSTEDVSMQISNANNAIMNVYAIDSRGNSTSKSLSSDFINYSSCYISSVLLERQQNGIGSEVKLTYSGYIWNGNFGKVQNSIKNIKYYYKLAGTEEWKEGKTVLSPTISGNNFSQSILIAGDLAGKGFDINNSYEIKMAISDELTELKETSTTIIGQGIPLIAYAKKGIGVNQFFDDNIDAVFQVNGNINSQDGILQAKPVSLYRNNEGNNGDISLNQSSASFTMLKILFRDNDNYYGSVDVYNPNEKIFVMKSVHFIASSNDAYFKGKAMKISGTSITNVSYGEINLNSNTVNENNTIYITEVLGYLL